MYFIINYYYYLYSYVFIYLSYLIKMNRKVVVLDAKGHLIGRLASYVAKQLQLGQKVIIVRCESVLISGKHYRNKLNFMDFLRKRTNTNPKKGPIHQKAPSRIVFRTIRGMLPHKTAKGAAALGRLKCYDGVPLSMNHKKKMVIPDALKAVRLRPRSKYSVLGNIAKECGWTKQDLIDSLETKRKTANRKWHTTRIQTLKKQRGMMKSNKDIQEVNKQLADYGY